MKPTDIVPIETWVAFEAELHERFDVNGTVYDTAGVGVTGKPTFCNAVCPIIKSHAESLSAICATGNRNLAHQAQKSKKTVVDECDAGLIKITSPIFVGGEFVGTAGCCGRLEDDSEVEVFLIHKLTGVPDAEIAAATEGVSVMPKDEITECVAFLEQRISEYVKLP